MKVSNSWILSAVASLLVLSGGFYWLVERECSSADSCIEAAAQAKDQKEQLKAIDRACVFDSLHACLGLYVLAKRQSMPRKAEDYGARIDELEQKGLQAIGGEYKDESFHKLLRGNLSFWNHDRLLEILAGLGDPVSQAERAEVLRIRAPVKQNSDLLESSRKLLLAAAEARWAPAMYKLGRFYLQKGLPTYNPEEATRWLSLACMHHMAQACGEAGGLRLVRNPEITRDPEMGIRLYLTGARLRDCTSALAASEFYVRALQFEKNYDLPFKHAYFGSLSGKPACINQWNRWVAQRGSFPVKERIPEWEKELLPVSNLRGRIDGLEIR